MDSGKQRVSRSYMESVYRARVLSLYVELVCQVRLPNVRVSSRCIMCIV